MVLTPPTALWVIPVSDLAGVARHALDVARAGIPGWRVVFLTPPGDLPRELRAVGAAVGRNPISFVVPCHRALGKNGALTGYHWGLTRKRAMLGWESGQI